MRFSARRRLADEELSRARPFSSATFHGCPGPVRSGTLGGDVDLNGHSQIVRWETGPSAMQRYRLPWIAHHRDTHEVAVADDPACRIEIDPPGARQIDLYPGVRVSAAGIGAVVVVRDMQISGDKACGHPKRAHSLDHEHGKVATAPASNPESATRVLNPLLMPGHVDEGLLDCPGQTHEKRTRVGRSTRAQEALHPLVELVIGVRGVPFDEAKEIRHVLRPVDERIGAGKILDIHITNIGRGVIETNGAVEAKGLGLASKARYSDTVAEDILDPPQIRWFGSDLEL